MKLSPIRLIASGVLSSLLACGGSTAEQPGPDAATTPDVVTPGEPDASNTPDAGPLPPAAHSSSFFPVQGVLDNGQPAGDLYWDYRVDHGQPHVNGFDSSQTFQFQDEIQTIQQATLTQTLDATISGSASGTTSEVITEQIDLATSAIQSTTDDDSTSIATGSADINLSYTWMPSSPGFFDRTDLDTLAVGYSESASPSASVTGTLSANGTMQSYSGTVSVSTSWSLQSKLASYTVLGVDYMDVVEVQVTSTANAQLTDSSGQSSTSTTTTTTNEWLARGVGIIYGETTTQQQNGTDMSIVELVATNLVPTGFVDAGADGGALEGGGAEGGAGDAGGSG